MARRTVLTRRQRSALFSLPPREADLRRHDTLSDDDLQHIGARRRPRNQLDFEPVRSKQVSLASPAGSRSRRTVAPVSRAVVYADASGPNGCTPNEGCFVSGVSTPVNRTV